MTWNRLYYIDGGNAQQGYSKIDFSRATDWANM